MSTEHAPYFSVVIPTHARPRLLKRAVASVYAQTYADWELLIVNDGPDLDAGSSPRDGCEGRIRWIKSSGDIGAAGARNLGANQARGRFLAFLDDDDEWLPTYLESIHLHLASSAASVTWCDIEVVEREGGNHLRRRVKRASAASGPTGIVPAPVDFIAEIGAGWGLCIRRELFASVGGFDSALQTSEDRDLLIRLVSGGHPYSGLAQALVRVHADAEQRLSQLGRSVDRARRSSRDEALMIERHRPFLVQHPTLHQKLLRSLAGKQYVAADLDAYLRTTKEMRALGYRTSKAFRRSLRLRFLRVLRGRPSQGAPATTIGT